MSNEFFKQIKRVTILWIPILICSLKMAHAAPEYPPDIERIKQRGSIRVAIYGKQDLPYIMRDKQGNLFGFDIDLANLLAKKLGVKLSINSESQYYDEIIDRVVNRQVDIAISSISRTLRRGEKVRFSMPYMQLTLSLLISRLNTNEITDADDVIGIFNQKTIKIGVLERSSREYYAANLLPKAQVIRFTSINAVFNAVKNGAVNVGLVDNVDVNTHFKLYPESALWLQAIELKDNQDTIGIAVNYQDEQLISWIDLFIETMSEDNNLVKLQRRYMEEDAWIHDVQK